MIEGSGIFWRWPTPTSRWPLTSTSVCACPMRGYFGAVERMPLECGSGRGAWLNDAELRHVGQQLLCRRGTGGDHFFRAKLDQIEPVGGTQRMLVPVTTISSVASCEGTLLADGDAAFSGCASCADAGCDAMTARERRASTEKPLNKTYIGCRFYLLHDILPVGTIMCRLLCNSACRAAGAHRDGFPFPADDPGISSGMATRSQTEHMISSHRMSAGLGCQSEPFGLAGRKKRISRGKEQRALGERFADRRRPGVTISAKCRATPDRPARPAPASEHPSAR